MVIYTVILIMSSKGNIFGKIMKITNKYFFLTFSNIKDLNKKESKLRHNFKEKFIFYSYYETLKSNCILSLLDIKSINYKIKSKGLERNNNNFNASKSAKSR